MERRDFGHYKSLRIDECERTGFFFTICERMVNQEGFQELKLAISYVSF